MSDIFKTIENKKTLRDEFAMHALTALIADCGTPVSSDFFEEMSPLYLELVGEEQERDDESDKPADNLAQAAYLLADAMMRERIREL